MKVENRGDSCFIAHEGVSIFFNFTKEGTYHIRVNKQNIYDGFKDKWGIVAEMKNVDKDSFKRLIAEMSKLV